MVFSRRRKSKSRKVGERKPCTLSTHCPKKDHNTGDFVIAMAGVIGNGRVIEKANF